MAPFRRYPLYKFILAGLDCAVLMLAWFAATRLDTTGDAPAFSLPSVLTGGLATVIAAASFQMSDLYKLNFFLSFLPQVNRVARSLIATIAILAIVSFFSGSASLLEGRLAVAYFWPLALGATLAVRVVLYRPAFMLLSSQRVLQRQILIVGAGEIATSLAASLLVHKQLGMHVVGFLDDQLAIGKTVFSDGKVLGRVDDVCAIAEEYGVGEIIICLDGVDQARFMAVLEKAVDTGRAVKVSSPLYGVISARLEIERYGEIPVVHVARSGPAPRSERVKRVADLALTAIGGLVLLPVFVLIALAIKLDSRGPVLFRQVRIGRNGKAFAFYKFRSMVVGSDRDPARQQRAQQFIRNSSAGNGGESTKIVNEANVTRVGRFLRRTSLDELPQLINVLRGEMSLVGPRPCLPYEWDQYEEWHKRRLAVVPGCTGVWQVAGRSVVGFNDMVILDFYYIQNQSLLLDLKLLAWTIPVMVLGKGAQ